MDFNFLLEDGTIAHIEFESDALNDKDLIRFGHYDLALYDQRNQKIHRIIIFSSGVPKTVLKELDIGSVKQKHGCIFLEHDFNGDEIFDKIKETIIKGNPLTNIDKLQIILLSMMKTNQTTPSQRAFELAETLHQYPKDIKHFLIGAMVAINYNHINNPERKKILEVLKMAKPFEDLYKEYEQKGIEEGIKKGIQEERKEVAKRLLEDRMEFEFIKKVTKLSDQEIYELMQGQ